MPLVSQVIRNIYLARKPVFYACYFPPSTHVSNDMFSISRSERVSTVPILCSLVQNVGSKHSGVTFKNGWIVPFIRHRNLVTAA